MPGTTLLHISLQDVPSLSVFAPGETAWNEHRGGSETLLDWLETQLGLLSEAVPLSSRIIEFAGVLDAFDGKSYAESLKTDRWATAAELLSRRDELRMAGWHEIVSEVYPSLVNDLARACEHRPMTWPDMTSRLLGVLEALDSGQTLPPHTVVLNEKKSQWPLRWQSVLARLTIRPAETASPLAPSGSMLHRAQASVLSGEHDPIDLDLSLRWVKSGSVFSACEFVAGVLATRADRLAQTVVYCEDATAALCLDGCLDRLGLPTMGVVQESLAHPVFQVLPLALNLMWEPVDPELVLAFLSLPVNPLRRRATWRLAAALAEQPGLGSRAWSEAVEALCQESGEDDKALREKLSAWLDGPRFRRGTSISATAVREVCGRVAQWATGLSSFYTETKDVPASLIDALRSVAGQASTLGQLAESHGGELSEPQINRLRDASVSFGGVMAPFPMTVAGPRYVTNLAEIGTNCSQLIWLGQSTADRSGCRWPFMDLAQLEAVGIQLDNGMRRQTILRDAERRGFSRIKDSVLAVTLPADEAQKTHPLWVQIKTMLPKASQTPLLLEDLLSEEEKPVLSPWHYRTELFEVRPPQPVRPLWSIPEGLLEDRQKSSASELTDRLSCPLKWVFNYQAQLRRSAFASIPDDFQLKGNFCHSMLQLVFGAGGELPGADAAVLAVEKAFDERLPLDAAPLAQPMRIVERHKLRDSLRRATRALVAALHQGNYRIEGIEVEVAGSVHGRELTGSIDCLAVGPDGGEAVIDFKYAGDKKYQKLVEEGRAVQLATYAYARSQQSPSKGFPAVAYLIIDKARLISAHDDRLAGQSGGIPGKRIQDIWEEFAGAVAGADSWLSDSQPVPARPLQSPADWPQGAELVLSATLKDNESQEACRYCDYPTLCGRKELA